MFKTILLPIDLASETGNERPLQLAASLARESGGTLHVMSVLPDFGMSIVGSFFDKEFETTALADMSAKLKTWAANNVPEGVSSEVHLAHGTIYDEIMRMAEKLNCDAIVMAAHRPELKDYMLGPNAARVVRHANQSVLVVRD